MTEHTTHYEDCGCLSKRFAERIAELETKVERLKTRVIAEEDDKNKRLDEMRAALAKQSLHVEDCHRQVEQAEAKLADCAKTCGGLEYRLEQAEALIATLKTKLAVRLGERDADRLMIALQDRDLWQAEFESGLWHAECIMSAIAADNAVAELAALKARRCETCRSQEEGLSYCSTLDVLTTEGFYCADWEARR